MAFQVTADQSKNKKKRRKSAALQKSSLVLGLILGVNGDAHQGESRSFLTWLDLFAIPVMRNVLSAKVLLGQYGGIDTLCSPNMGCDVLAFGFLALRTHDGISEQKKDWKPKAV